MDEIPEKADAAGAVSLDAVKGDIQFSNVTFGCDREKLVLKNISFHAAAGQKVALVGSTGAGKTKS